MLDNLLEIEVAYNLLSSSTDESGIDPIDAHYAKLNCGIEVLDKDSEEFKIIEKYTKNTHAATHNLFSLELEHVFKIDRPTEKTRYLKFYCASIFVCTLLLGLIHTRHFGTQYCDKKMFFNHGFQD
jgi:hypothetical protein